MISKDVTAALGLINYTCLVTLACTVAHLMTHRLPGCSEVLLIELSTEYRFIVRLFEVMQEQGSTICFPYVYQCVYLMLPCRRGKHGRKHYTVFIGKLSPDVKSSFQPRLNNEHSQWKWFELTDAMRQSNLHPVVELMFADPHKQQLVKAVGS